MRLVLVLATLVVSAVSVRAVSSWHTEYKMHTSKNDDLMVAASESEPGFVLLWVEGAPMYLTPDEADSLGELLHSSAFIAKGRKR